MKKFSLTFLGLFLTFTFCISLFSCSDDNEENEITPVINGGTPSHVKAVDLGLSSGTLWANCNIGASSPEDYGDYFAWGEIIGINNGKTYFSWKTYKYCEGTDTTITKYCNDSIYGYGTFMDNLTELSTSDDAACVHWSNDWRTPSNAQMEELVNDCTWDTIHSDVNGFKVTGPNGNSIFLPAAGFYDDWALLYAGERSCYWTRTLDEESSKFAYYMYFSLLNVYTGHNDRYGGYTIRPVRAL